jgi:uncharacterized protein YbgA (DUF1722 family)/uncharacterized protein YbbK (DUF523 family)
MGHHSAPKLGVSSCLLGQAVRYDGTDKLDHYIADYLSRHFDLSSFCPEVAIGLGVPRETIKLVGSISNPRVLGTKTPNHDVTNALQAYAQSLDSELSALSGYMVKSRSPSCGMHHVNIYPEFSDKPVPQGRGVFITEVLRLFPQLPIIDEEQLKLADLRHHFFERVYAYFHWRQLQTPSISAGGLIKFHSRYKYAVMAREEVYCHELDRLSAMCHQREICTCAEEYFSQFMAILARQPSRQGHVNVLHHLMGYFKRQLNQEQKHRLNHEIERFRNEQCHLTAPVDLLKTYLEEFPNDYLAQQSYLFPYPETLM